MCRRPTVEAEPSAPEELCKDESWLVDFDFEGFTEEIRALGKKLESEQGPADVDHLNKMILWSNLFAAAGLLTLGVSVNILTIFCMSTYTFTRWTMIAHHVCHGGYEKCHPNPNRWSRFKFALGTFWRRFNDWFDWMMPEAWNVEHNTRHHYNLGENTDPDLVENNAALLRETQAPVFLKYIALSILTTNWKWFYYSPNTYKELKLAKMRREGKKLPEGVIPEDAVTLRVLLMGEQHFYSLWEWVSVVVGPYFLFHFVLTPLPWYALGEFLDGYTGMQMYTTAVINLALADMLTNFHGFLCVVTNHAGHDMYKFREPCRPYSGSFFLRQVLSSTNYHMGADLIDFMHGFLNYQIEHHLWPNLSMLSYQKAAPFVQEICARHGVPYVKQNVFTRLRKTAAVMVGSDDMRWFPKRYEELFLKTDVTMEQRKTK